MDNEHCLSNCMFFVQYFLQGLKSRLSSLSSSEEIFNDSVTPHQDALDKSGYKHKLKHQANINTANNKKQRKRNIVWFNPPYSKNVKTNIEKIFLNLITKHCHKFHKLFNKNTVKISYGCTQNIKTIINSNNAKILFPKKNNELAICKSRNGESGSRMGGMMVMRGIRVGMMGIRVEMPVMRGIKGKNAGNQGANVGNKLK